MTRSQSWRIARAMSAAAAATTAAGWAHAAPTTLLHTANLGPNSTTEQQPQMQPQPFFCNLKVTSLTYTGRRGSQHRGQTVTSSAKTSKAPHTAERRKQNSQVDQVQRASRQATAGKPLPVGSQQATASTTVSKPKGPSKALNRDLWGHRVHRGPRHSRHHAQPTRAHTRPAIQPHQSVDT